MNRDALINIRVSEDGMEAHMSITLSTKEGEMPSLADLETALGAENITYGIDQAQLTRLLEEKPMSELTIARGLKPKKSTPAYIKVKKRLYESRPPIEAHGQVDFKMVSPFIMVKKGESLARRIEQRPGEEGRSVRNNPISPEKKVIEQLQAGENTIEKEGVIYAVKAGRFELDNKVFSVNEVLDIPGNVDYSTGHISFPGDVIIHGQIKDGFRVAAGGSIHCKETLDASEVFTKKDLIIEGGIIGRSKGLIRVQGKVETKFIENCTVESQGGIAVRSSIVGSEIATLGELEIINNGKLMGGTVYAEKGITTQNVGSASSGSIKIFLGISFIEARQLASRQRLLSEVSAKRDKIKSLKNKEKKEELKAKVQATLDKLQMSIAEQISRQYTHFDALLRVTGDIYPGAIITICDRSYTVTDKMTHVAFYYNEEKQKIATRTL